MPFWVKIDLGSGQVLPICSFDARSFGGTKAFCLLFICQWPSSMPNSFRGNRIWWLHHNGFGLITPFSFILLLSFFGHWPFWIPLMMAMYQIVKAMHIYILYIYIYTIYIYCVCLLRLRNECPWKSHKFCDVEISTPPVGIDPTISRLHIKFH